MNFSSPLNFLIKGAKTIGAGAQGIFCATPKTLVWTGVALTASCLAWRVLSDYYTLPCPAFISRMVEMENPFFRSARASVIVGHLNIQSQLHALEIGCGPGRVTLPLAEALASKNGTLTVMDTQQAMLDKNSTKVKNAGLENVIFKKVTLGKDSIEKDLYDRVLLVNMFGEIPKKARLQSLKTIHQALKSGGILSISELICDPHFQTQSQVLRLAEEAGFQLHAKFGWWPSYTIHLIKKS